jgi:hypothetical protein
VLEWLYSIALLKENVPDLDRKLPKICKNGVIYFDLINRLEGKQSKLKGVIRKPRTAAEVSLNYSKVLCYLRAYEKMNPRYLWAVDHLRDGNEDVFWGFLDDIRYLYINKESPFDPRVQKRLTTSFVSSSSNTASKLKRSQRLSDRDHSLKRESSEIRITQEGAQKENSGMVVDYDEICYAKEFKGGPPTAEPSATRLLSLSNLPVSPVNQESKKVVRPSLDK